MVNIQIGLDGVPSLRKVTIGNKYENQDEVISFELPSEFDSFDKYVISVIKINGQKYTSILPIINNQLIVSTQLTQYAGKWSMYLMAREKTSLDLNTTPVDISAKDNEHIFISDGFIGIVSDSEIEKENIGTLTLDANLQIIYDDLSKLRDEIVERMKTPLSYTQLIDVPTEFNPASHDHDARYHTKEEMDLKLANKADVNHTHEIVDITDFPASLPANGGNADTVNGHTVLSNVPANAKFTDTVYIHPETHPASMITGLPTKLSEFVNDKKYQTANDVAKAISDLVKSAPNTLDTLEELANALDNDPNFATTIMIMLGEKASKADLTTKVDVVEGKTLSSNDFTNALKAKLTSLNNYDDTELRTLIQNTAMSMDEKLATKVSQVTGKTLTSNDFTDELKTKLESLHNYDDSKLKTLISDNQSALNSELAKKVSQVAG